MTEVTLLKQEVKPDKVTQLREWMATVQDRNTEALETLQGEGVYTETTFLEETTSGTFLVTYIEAADLERVWETFEESTHEIDREHGEVMQDCLKDSQSVGEYEPLYHLSNPER